MTGRSTALQRALLIALAFAMLAPNCGGGGGGPTHRIRLDAPDTVTWWTQFTVDVVVTSPGVQAWELEVEWQQGIVAAIDVQPHPEFDDDGALFLTPVYDHPNGRLSQVVDLRHGAAASGTFRVATIRFLALGQTGFTSIDVSAGGLAGPGGEELSAQITSARVLITD